LYRFAIKEQRNEVVARIKKITNPWVGTKKRSDKRTKQENEEKESFYQK
jgi:hypothetical protein